VTVTPVIVELGVVATASSKGTETLAEGPDVPSGTTLPVAHAVSDKLAATTRKKRI
jgi:hypothetical protein